MVNNNPDAKKENTFVQLCWQWRWQLFIEFAIVKTGANSGPKVMKVKSLTHVIEG